jgi:hypothetical protein
MYAAPHFVKHHDLHTHSCSPTCRKVLAVCDKPHTVHLRVGRQGSPRCARVHCGELDAPSTTTVDQCMCVHRHAAYAHHTTFLTTIVLRQPVFEQDSVGVRPYFAPSHHARISLTHTHTRAHRWQQLNAMHQITHPLACCTAHRFAALRTVGVLRLCQSPSRPWLLYRVAHGQQPRAAPTARRPHWVLQGAPCGV